MSAGHKCSCIQVLHTPCTLQGAKLRQEFQSYSPSERSKPIEPRIHTLMKLGVPTRPLVTQKPRHWLREWDFPLANLAASVVAPSPPTPTDRRDDGGIKLPRAPSKLSHARERNLRGRAMMTPPGVRHLPCSSAALPVGIVLRIP